MTILCGIVSSLFLRFSEKHERDDYRSATSLALEALREGHQVLWQGDMNAPRYYAHREGGMPMVNYIQRLESAPPTGYMFTDLIFINRPDLRYFGEDHRLLLKRENFELTKTIPGFEIWVNRDSVVR